MKKLVILMIFALAGAAHAQSTPVKLGDYGKWTAYSYSDAGGQVCYMASSPTASEGKYTTRGEPFVVVTHRPKEKTYGVVNFIAGYSYKSGAKVVVKIGTKVIDDIFTDGDKAWAINDRIDKDLIATMKKGDRMFVDGTSAKGTKTKDTYSLQGFSAAYKAISAKCK